jgi:hypothetical protein
MGLFSKIYAEKGKNFVPQASISKIYAKEKGIIDIYANHWNLKTKLNK